MRKIYEKKPVKGKADNDRLQQPVRHRQLSEEEAAVIVQRFFRLKYLRKKLANQAQKRRMVIDEIISTEEGYVEDLNTIQEVFLKPITKRGLMSAKQIQQVFSNMQIIYGLNKTLLTNLKTAREHSDTVMTTIQQKLQLQQQQLQLQQQQQKLSTKEKRKRSKGSLKIKRSKSKTSAENPPPTPHSSSGTSQSKITLGESIKKITPFLKIYTAYINNYPVAMKALKECRAQNVHLDTFLKRCKDSRSECRGMDISSFLIAPIQRIPRYELLIKELLKHTPEGHVDYHNLNSSYELIIGVNKHLNEQKREKEGLSKLLEIQRRLGISGDRDGDDSFDAFSQRDSMDLNSETSDTSAFTETARTSRGSDHLKHLLVQPHRKYIKESKLRIMKEKCNDEDEPSDSELDQCTKDSNSDFGTHWRTFDAYLFTDMLLFIGEKQREEPGTAPLGSKMTRHLHLCFCDASLIEGSCYFQIRFFVNGEVYQCEASNELEAKQWVKDIKMQREEELQKLAKLYNQRSGDGMAHGATENVDTLEYEPIDIMEIENAVRNKEHLQKLVPTRLREFAILKSKFYELKDQFDIAIDNLGHIRSMYDQVQHKLAVQEKNIEEMGGTIGECIQRLQKGAKVLGEYEEQTVASNATLLKCVRHDKQLIESYFGEEISFENIDIQHIMTEITTVESYARNVIKEQILSKRRQNHLMAKDIPGSPRHSILSPRQQSAQGEMVKVALEDNDRLRREVENLKQQVSAKKLLFDATIRERNELRKRLERQTQESSNTGSDDSLPRPDSTENFSQNNDSDTLNQLEIQLELANKSRMEEAERGDELLKSKRELEAENELLREKIAVLEEAHVLPRDNAQRQIKNLHQTIATLEETHGSIISEYKLQLMIMKRISEERSEQIKELKYQLEVQKRNDDTCSSFDTSSAYPETRYLESDATMTDNDADEVETEGAYSEDEEISISIGSPSVKNEEQRPPQRVPKLNLGTHGPEEPNNNNGVSTLGSKSEVMRIKGSLLDKIKLFEEKDRMVQEQAQALEERMRKKKSQSMRSTMASSHSTDDPDLLSGSQSKRLAKGKKSNRRRKVRDAKREQKRHSVGQPVADTTPGHSSRSDSGGAHMAIEKHMHMLHQENLMIQEENSKLIDALRESLATELRQQKEINEQLRKSNLRLQDELDVYRRLLSEKDSAMHRLRESMFVVSEAPSHDVTH